MIRIRWAKGVELLEVGENCTVGRLKAKVIEDNPVAVCYWVIG